MARIFTRGDLENAKRRALNMLDQWLNVTGIVEPHSGYYHELQGVIEDAVECGAQARAGIFVALDAEDFGEEKGVPSTVYHLHASTQ